MTKFVPSAIQPASGAIMEPFCVPETSNHQFVAIMSHVNDMPFVTVAVNIFVTTGSVNVVPSVTTCIPSASHGPGAVNVTSSS